MQDLVASGLYVSASEVVREALRLLQVRDRWQQAHLEGIRRQGEPTSPALGLPPAGNGKAKSKDNGKGKGPACGTRASEEVFAELEQQLSLLEGPWRET